MEKYLELKESKDEDDKLLAKKLVPKRKYVIAVVAYKDEKGKEVDEQNIDKPMLIPKQAYQDIIDLYLDEDEWGDMTSIKNGYDLKLTRSGKGQMDTTYTISPCQKKPLDKKMFGLFQHRVLNRKIPLVRGFDDVFLAPHSRHTEVPIADIHACKDLTVLAESEEAGLFLAMAEGGRKIFVMGHPEYDRVTLDGEYKRDLAKGLPIEIPKNYYKDDDPNNKPLLTWRAHANNLYTNWLNYYVYQSTPYDLYGTPDFREI